MAMLGQASGGFTESSSSLRLLHVGIRNSTGVLADDAFTQTNPVYSTLAGVQAAYATNSPQVATSVLGVLSGSIAFTRGDADGGNNEIGGFGFASVVADLSNGIAGVCPVGVFINYVAGYFFENTPALASSKSPYVSAQGTYANSLYETVRPLDGTTAVDYQVGDFLCASVNGLWIEEIGITAADPTNIYAGDNTPANFGNTKLAILKMTADSAQDEIMYDQRI